MTLPAKQLKAINHDIHINGLPETCIRVNQTRNDKACVTSKFAPFKEAIIGQRITHVWRGHGSTLFIEFGRLTQRTKRDGTPGQPHGEITLMVEWSWRIEKLRSIVGGSWSTERRWSSMLKKFIGATVEDIELFGEIPEVRLSLSNGYRLLSFMTAEGQPGWALISQQSQLGTLLVRKGRLFIEKTTISH